ncbi:hypothetical protein CFP65_2191 [Kitasatospora sp. MMS16-BH015]|uniref:hypothetical protein n=1 Tax=Kitasatospora sp. MMS16-BH015 TaxID=2018025 RepID=UPI000CA1F695|nr:hypothetical protein [Kitasatospora sp. MMS16-BH015]AUG77038.1 hypothetical protein CFP65_2191 [Kitasatospora sp. MMS16-BH015]
MAHWRMLLYGAIGGGLISLLTLYRFIQSKRRWPWRVKNGPTPALYLTGEAIRVVLGSLVAWGLAASGQLGALGAMIVGAGAPAILDKWQAMAPQLHSSEPPAPAPRPAGVPRGRESQEDLTAAKILEGGAQL